MMISFSPFGPRSAPFRFLSGPSLLYKSSLYTESDTSTMNRDHVSRIIPYSPFFSEA